MRGIRIAGYHPEWQVSRILFMLKLYDESFWINKNVLELGSYNGVIGNHFRSLGSNVLSIDGRESNIIMMKRFFPELNTMKYDLDTDDWPFGNFDVIINFGLIYHLEKNHRSNIINCIKNCKLLFLESVIYDSSSSEFYETPGLALKTGDQGLSYTEKIPTRKYVEDIFDELNVDYQIYNEKELNGGGHTYDWEEKNSHIFDGFQRRFWIVKNKDL